MPEHARHALAPQGLSSGPAAQSPDLQRAWARRFGAALLTDQISVFQHGPGAYLPVAIGPQALKQVMDAPTFNGGRDAASQSGARWVAILTAHGVVEQIISSAPGATDPASASRKPLISALYADPSVEQQLALIAALFGVGAQVGVVLTATGMRDHRASLTHAADTLGLALRLVTAPPQSTMLPLVAQLQDVHALLLLPDGDLYTATTLRLLIEWSYARRVPLVGYSASMVAAGTLASAYAHLDDTMDDLADVLLSLDARGLPPSRHVRYWRVAVNDRVARAFNLPIDDAVRQLGHRGPQR